MVHKSKDSEIFGENIRFLRKAHGLTQKQMAQIMGISLYCLQKTEQGFFPNSLYMDALLRTARHFHLHPALLFTPQNIH